MPTTPALNLIFHFVRREISSRYLGSFSGGLWALMQPLIQLAVYGFVWTYVFGMRPPGGADAPGIVPFLAMGVWPWNAFAEALHAFDHRDSGQFRADRQGRVAARDPGVFIGSVEFPAAMSSAFAPS